jgi:hypothetical protein
MSDLTYDGMLRVAFVPTIADIAAPKVSELEAGTDLTPRLAPDGVARSADTGTVEVPLTVTDTPRTITSPAVIAA